jgi:four helix bundle protein
MSYKNLEIWKLSKDLSIDIHTMTLTLPGFEQFEEAQQIRKSSKKVRSTIVEGYARSNYKADFIRFLRYAIASNDETMDHLEMLFETGSLKSQVVYESIHKRIQMLGRKLDTFLQGVQELPDTHGSLAEPNEMYTSEFSGDDLPHHVKDLTFNIQGPASSFLYVY